MSTSFRLALVSLPETLNFIRDRRFRASKGRDRSRGSPDATAAPAAVRSTSKAVDGRGDMNLAPQTAALRAGALALLVAAFVAPSVHARPYPPEPGEERIVHTVYVGQAIQQAVPDVFERAVARHKAAPAVVRAAESGPRGEPKNEMPFTRPVG
jgi:hypothetical protein